MTANFVSWNDYSKFANAVEQGRRHIFDAATDAFVRAVAETSKSRITVLPPNSDFFRAQIAHRVRTESAYDQYNEEEVSIGDFAMPCEESRLRPYSDRAREGRANPKGHPVFYAATDEETAIAEVRPWIGAYVTIGLFNTTSPLRVVDCSRHVRETTQKSAVRYAMNDHFGKDPAIREESVWVHIEEAFAKPLTPSDERADYLPTQIIAEVFMGEGYDGLLFKSSVADGKNLVVFDLSKLYFFESHVAVIKEIKFSFNLGSYDGIELD